ncbi:MAG: hypothetical protein E6G50_02055 [Actinobacteria bacterium]|nr:MAG: hypothetical protein E6G50_02055 [Actinomycetota bacterium]
MPLVHACREPGCGTLTMGERCLEHELLDRGRGRTRLRTAAGRFRGPALALALAAAAALMGRASGRLLP